MLFVLIFFIIGIIISWTINLPQGAIMIVQTISETLLFLLLFLIGFQTSQDKRIFKNIKKYPMRIFVLAASVIIGTTLGAIISGFILNISIKKSLLVSAGMGFYSLSSFILIKEGYIQIAQLSFLSNVSRELIGLFSVPIVSRFYGLLPAAAAGSAADTILPIIAKYNKSEEVIISIGSAFVLTLIVPIIITIILSWIN